MIKANKEEINSILRNFIGTYHYYRDSGVVHTDGVHWLAENCECFWLLDVIASWQRKANVRKEEFQIWKLTVAENKSAIITCTDGNEDTPEICRQEIPYTTFPLDEITLFYELGSIDMVTPCFVLMLPSER